MAIVEDVCQSCRERKTCKKTSAHIEACLAEANDYADLDDTPCLEDEGYTTRSDY